jgi:cytochrome c peroxidase
MRRIVVIAALLAGIALTSWWLTRPDPDRPWSAGELAVLESLWLGSLPPPPPDPSNAVADDPRAARLGYKLFFDMRLSANGEISCGFCHQPERNFTDALPVAQGIGKTERHTMSVVGAAYSPWQFWDGRKDSLWSQALAPLEDPLEHGGHRLQYARVVAKDPQYRREYESLFGLLPEIPEGPWASLTEQQQHAVTTVFVNIGKSIAAYERLLVHGESRFDKYVAALMDGDEDGMRAALSADEKAGLRLFIGDAQCINCHNGPLFTNNEFHNTAVLPQPGKLPALGRVSAVREARADPFNCLGDFSDDETRECPELRFTKTGDDLIGAQKTPSLRSVTETSPYMHGGQMMTLAEVIDQYNRAPLALVGHNEAKPLSLSARERRQLEAFLGSLSAPLATDPKWLKRPPPRKDY